MTSRYRSAAVLALALSAGCSGSQSAVTSTEPSVVTTTVAATTTVAPTTTTTTVAPTTTTIPPLDTSEGAAVARMRADLEVLMSGGPRISGTAAEAAAASYFAAQAEAITGLPAEIQSFPLPNGTTSNNVWVAPIGTGNMVVMLGSHLDSIAGSPGADDNGSGSVILLEFVRRLTEQPLPGLRVVVVGFGAEERIPGFDHHFGSRFAVDGLVEVSALPAFMVSVDMVGFGEQLYAVTYEDSDPSLADTILILATELGIDVTRTSRGENSDHVSFARAGVPAALLNRRDNPGYHTAGDDDVRDEALLDTITVLKALLEFLSSGE